MKKSLIICSIIIVVLLVISFFSSRKSLQAQTLYSMYGNVWYLHVDSCAPYEGYDLSFKIIYEETLIIGPYYSPNNCFWGYNTEYGAGKYEVFAWHEDDQGDTITMGSTKFNWTGPYERHDIRVFDFGQPDP